MKRIVILSLMSLFLLVLSACGFKSPTEKMYDKLEEVVSIEGGFEEQQEPLVTLEKEEQGIYNKIINLSLDEMDEITKLSDQALNSIANRKEHMEKEEDSIMKSKEKFETIKEDIDDLDEEKDKDLKKKAEDLYQTMIERYKVHDDLYANYINGLEQDKKLYEMFKQEDASMEDLEAQVKKINETYQKVYDNNEKFNELTKKYNELKIDFYKKAGIDIQETEDK